MVLTLYKLDASPPVRAVVMTIGALKIPDVKLVDVNPLIGEHLKEDFLKKNPQHTIPMLQDDDFYVWDSHAIAVYLVTKYGADNTLYPTDPKKRALIDQRLHFDSGILFPALRASAEPVLFWGAKSFKSESLDKIKSGYEFTEKFLTSPWLVGNELTLADICCVSSISTMNEMLPIDGNLYPKLTAWLGRCSQLDFYKKHNLPGLLAFREVINGNMA